MIQESHSDWQNGKAFPSQGILERQGKSQKILEKSENFRPMLFIMF